MSLVGTRPPTVDEWEKYELHHRSRMSTKPGITGMWQVSGRSDITDFEEVVRLDTEYMGALLGKLDNISVSQLLKAFMGQECGTINGEWWYVTLYLKFLIVFPFISLGIEKIKNISFKIVYFFVVGVISIKVLGSYGLLFVVGIMCANFNLINRLSYYFSREKTGKYVPIILIAVGGV